MKKIFLGLLIVGGGFFVSGQNPPTLHEIYAAFIHPTYGLAFTSGVVNHYFEDTDGDRRCDVLLPSGGDVGDPNCANFCNSGIQRGWHYNQ